MTTVRMRVAETGDLFLPREFCRALGRESGGDIIIEQVGDEFVLRPAPEMTEQAADADKPKQSRLSLALR